MLANYEIRPYEPDDFYATNFGDSCEMLTGMPEKTIAEFYGKQGPAFSGFADGEIIACAGVFIKWPGTGESWCRITPKVFEHKRFFFVQSGRYLDLIAKQKNLQRIEANVQASNERALKFVDHLGFKCEGPKLKYFNGETFFGYAKFYGGEE